MQIAVALMADPEGRHWGYEIWRSAGIRSGAMYPILGGCWKQAAGRRMGGRRPGKDGRPPRRYDLVTGEGKKQLGALLESARTEPRFRHLFSEEQQHG